MRHIYYRGSLKSCNYNCSYCPFAKKGAGRRQQERDREEFVRFVETISREEFHGTVQIVPYGEALIHAYYWQGMAELSGLPSIQAVGAQSNFSFPVEDMLGEYGKSGGKKEKLRLWGTFHPEMTTVEAFLEQCRLLQEAGVLFCVGGVGVPENLERLRRLRDGLDESVYLWINKMDGLGRAYTPDERRAFLELDPYFELELRPFPVDAAACAESIFVQGDGSVRPCNLCHGIMGNLYTDGLAGLPQKKCTRKVCDCFLSYGSRTDMEELRAFYPHPVFRIRHT